jgi:integrase
MPLPQPPAVYPNKRSPPWVSEPHLPQHLLARQPFRNCPAAHYINTLNSKDDRQKVYSRLRRIAVFLSGDECAQPIDYPWWTLDALATGQVRHWIRDKSLHYQRNLVSALRGVLKQCLRLGYMKADDYLRATMDLKTPSPPPSPKGRYVPPEDVRALFAAIANEPDERVCRRDTALFAVAFFQALRHSELRSLNLGDVCLERKTLTVRGKRRRVDVLPLHSATLLALTRWIRIYDLSEDLPADTPLFVSLKTSGWRERLVRLPEYTMLALPHRWAEQANIAHFTWHDARRTNASTMLDTERIDPYSARKLLRHSRYASTQVYDHRGNATLRRDIDKLSYGLPLEEKGARLVAELRAQAAKDALCDKPPVATDEPTPDPVEVLSQLINDKFRELEQRLLSSQPTPDATSKDDETTDTQPLAS